VRLTTSPSSCAESHEIWDPKPTGTPWATPGLLRNPFTFIYAYQQFELLLLSIQNNQRDALNIIYSSNIITLLYMFRVSSTHLQEDIVVHKQRMVPSLCKR